MRHLIRKNRGDPLSSKLIATATALAVVLTAVPARAATAIVLPPSTQFDVTGYIQSATLVSAGKACAARHTCGGTVLVNGLTITIPDETVVIFPAAAWTWQEVFELSPVAGTTGMALPDKPLTSYEIHVVGNRVLDAAGNDRYIAGLVNISQQSLNSGAGYINYMDYTNGEMWIGSTIANPPVKGTGTRVRFNDPKGRFGRAMTGTDIRFQVDDQNPTIAAGTGYPMCFPRFDPKTTPDPLCPQSNRQLAAAPDVYLMSQTMSDPTAAGFLPGQALDPFQQAPMEVGDYVTFAGTLSKDAQGIVYVSAHTVISNVAIYTSPGTNPAYVSIEVSLIGTGGLSVLGAGEAAIRTRFEGMTTDPSRNVHLYGIDYDANGNPVDRDFGYIGVDPGAPNGAVKGRWRFRPPCLPAGSVSTKPDKECIMNAAGTFLPPPREVRAVIDAAPLATPPLSAGWVVGQTATASNGITYGQYHAPIGEYIFPENIPGTPIVENNFNTIDFLVNGGYSSSADTASTGHNAAVASQLSPWPSNVNPNAPPPPPPPPGGGETVLITTAQYRISKQRLDMTVTDSNPNTVTITLLPYACANATSPQCPGGVFDPSRLGNVFTFAGVVAGVPNYTLTLVGAPEPAIPPATPMQVQSSTGSQSPKSALTNIRN